MGPNVRDIRARNVARRRIAFTAVEVMLAVAILALALIPIIGTIADTGREAGFSENHLLANARVQSMLDAAEAMGWFNLPPGQARMVLPVPETAGDPPEALYGPAPEQYGEVLYVDRLEDGLLRLGARVRWANLVPGKGTRVSDAASMRLLRRPDGSWTKLISLDRGGASAATP